jgi:hypothetical protein
MNPSHLFLLNTPFELARSLRVLQWEGCPILLIFQILPEVIARETIIWTSRAPSFNAATQEKPQIGAENLLDFAAHHRHFHRP